MKQPTELYIVAVERPVRGEEDVPLLERRRLPVHQFPPATTPEAAEALKQQALENFGFEAGGPRPMIVAVRTYQLDGEISVLCRRPG